MTSYFSITHWETFSKTLEDTTQMKLWKNELSSKLILPKRKAYEKWKKNLWVFWINQYKYKNKIRDTPFERLTNLSNDQYFGCFIIYRSLWKYAHHFTSGTLMIIIKNISNAKKFIALQRRTNAGSCEVPTYDFYSEDWFSLRFSKKWEFPFKFYIKNVQ